MMRLVFYRLPVATALMWDHLKARVAPFFWIAFHNFTTDHRQKRPWFATYFLKLLYRKRKENQSPNTIHGLGIGATFTKDFFNLAANWHECCTCVLFVYRGCVHLHLCFSNTVDGRNPAPVEVGSLSHYVRGFYIPGGAELLPYWRSPQDRNIFSVCAAVAAHVLAPVGCERFWQHSRCRNWWLMLRLGRWGGWRCSICESCK